MSLLKVQFSKNYFKIENYPSIHKRLLELGEKVKLGELISNGAKIIDVRSGGEFQGGTFE